MNPLNKNQYPINTVLVQENPAVPILPDDIIKHIFSFLSDKDKETTVHLNKSFQKLTIKQVKDEIFQDINTLIRFFSDLLKNHPELMNKLKFLIEPRDSIENMLSLVQIRCLKNNITIKIAEILKDLSSEDLTKVLTYTELKYKELFLLAKKLQLINQYRNPSQPYEFVDKIKKTCGEIASMGFHDLAIQIVTELMPSEHWKAWGFNEICSELISLKKFKSAIELAYLMPTGEQSTEKTFSDIAESLAKNKKFKEAIEIAKKNPCSSGQISSLKSIAYYLIENSYFEEALVLANSIEDDFDRDDCLEKRCENLVKKGQIDWAIKGANHLIFSFKRSSVIEQCVKYLLNQNNMPKALELAFLVKNTEREAFPLLPICYYLVGQKNYKKAVDIMSLIDGSKFHELQYLFKIIMEKNEPVNKIMNLALSIEDEQDRCDALGEIALFLLKKGDFESANAIFPHIFSLDLHGKTEYDIIYELVKMGQLIKSMELAPFIVDNEYREIAKKQIIPSLNSSQISEFTRVMGAVQTKILNEKKEKSSVSPNNHIEKLMARGHFLKAIEYISTLTPSEKPAAYLLIVQCHILFGDDSKALEITNTKLQSNTLEKDSALVSISFHIATKQNKAKAISIANQISNPSKRTKVLKDIEKVIL